LEYLLWRQELRSLLLSPSLWLMLVILSWLVGYSFIQAVDLFSQASKTALAYPQLAKGMNAMEGVFVPTFGAYYLVETLLFPFVVIRLMGHDKQTGTLKLLLQLPISTFGLNAIKLAALVVAGLLFLLPAASAVIAWHFLGGEIHVPALFTLLLGHILYGLTIACIAMFASVVASTPATAAMICLAATLGSWVLDFSAGSGGWMAVLSQGSLTTLLRQFESGLLSSTAIGGFLMLSLLFYLLASILLHPGRPLLAKLKAMVWIIVVLGVLFFLIVQKPFYLDVTEDHRHSFNPADVRAFKAMEAPLEIRIHMTREDGRAYDLERSVLSKLRRVVPQLQITYVAASSPGLFGAAQSDTYGLIEYDYQGRHDQSYSTSPREILPLIHALAGQKIVPDPEPDYTGHPLVADATPLRWWFYLIMPLAFLIVAWRFRHPRFFPLSFRESVQ
jgi:ABC-type transport system involved in multi-copper enzyme maturation permease subunit